MEITEAQGDTDVIPEVPSQWKYVFIGEVWSYQGTPTHGCAHPILLEPLPVRRAQSTMRST